MKVSFANEAKVLTFKQKARREHSIAALVSEAPKMCSFFFHKITWKTFVALQSEWKLSFSLYQPLWSLSGFPAETITVLPDEFGAADFWIRSLPLKGLMFPSPLPRLYKVMRGVEGGRVLLRCTGAVFRHRTGCSGGAAGGLTEEKTNRRRLTLFTSEVAAAATFNTRSFLTC